jgi:phosphohistidine phosphatase
MQVYLLRHGIAEDAEAGQSDADRALTSEGRDKLRRVLKRARAAGVEPAVVLSSPLKRAVETAEVAADSLGFKDKITKTRALVPGGSPHDVWEEVRGQQGVPAILLAGHEPLMSALVAFLLGTPTLAVDMKKAALVRIDIDRLGPEPRGVLKWMLTPATAVE